MAPASTGSGRSPTTKRACASIAARHSHQRCVGGLEEGIEGGELETAADRAIGGVEARTPVHAVGVERAAEVEEDDVGGRPSGGRARGARARPSSWAWTWAFPP